MKAGFFVLDYGGYPEQYVTPLAKSARPFSLRALGKAGQDHPNLTVLARQALRNKKGRWQLWRSDDDYGRGQYFVFRPFERLWITDDFAKARSKADTLPTDYNVVIGRSCIVHRPFPPQSTDSPFDERATKRLFIYRENDRASSFSYLFGDQTKLTPEIVIKSIAIGQSNLLFMKRLALRLGQRLVEFEKALPKNGRILLFDESGKMTKCNGYRDALNRSRRRSATVPRDLIGQQFDEWYWH